MFLPNAYSTLMYTAGLLFHFWMVAVAAAAFHWLCLFLSFIFAIFQTLGVCILSALSFDYVPVSFSSYFFSIWPGMLFLRQQCYENQKRQ